MSDMITTREVATLLGMSLDSFYRVSRTLHDNGMPRKSGAGHRPWHKPSILAWLARYHPLAPKRAAANDSAPLTVPRDDAEHREFLHQHYGARR